VTELKKVDFTTVSGVGWCLDIMTLSLEK